MEETVGDVGWLAGKRPIRRINETLPKVVGRQPFTHEIQTLHILEITPFSANAG